MVRFLDTHVARHALALETRDPGVWRWPMEPGARWESEFPWVFMPPAKLWRFMVPAKPLPTVVPVTATTCPTREHIDFSARRRPPATRLRPCSSGIPWEV